MVKVNLKKHLDKLRFGLVGIANTVVDFCVLFIVFNLFGVDKIIANYISTSFAMTFSFFANKHFTFKSEGVGKKKGVLFFVITGFTAWIVQPLIIWASGIMLGRFNLNPNFTLLISKSLAIGVSLIINYILYSKVVFKKKAPSN